MRSYLLLKKTCLICNGGAWSPYQRLMFTFSNVKLQLKRFAAANSSMSYAATQTNLFSVVLSHSCSHSKCPKTIPVHSYIHLAISIADMDD